MAVLIGAFALGQVGPNFAAFASAQAAGTIPISWSNCAHYLPSSCRFMAAYKLFDIIDRKPGIDSSSALGVKPVAKDLKGDIEFRDVTFAYPSRPTEIILQNFNLRIEGGTHVALVGESGSGKSTLLQLVQRFYDPSAGVGKYYFFYTCMPKRS